MRGYTLQKLRVGGAFLPSRRSTKGAKKEKIRGSQGRKKKTTWGRGCLFKGEAPPKRRWPKKKEKKVRPAKRKKRERRLLREFDLGGGGGKNRQNVSAWGPKGGH